MVQIYLEPIGLRHYARFFSGAVWWRIVGIIFAIALTYTVAYTSGGFWFKTNTVYEQPYVRFGYGMYVLLEGIEAGQERAWSSFPDTRSLLGDKLMPMTVEVQEFDDNIDGSADIIKITATGRGIDIPVQSAKVLLDFDYRLTDSLEMHMMPLVYVTHASPVPGSVMYTFGELSLVQRDPLLDGTQRSIYNESLLVPHLRRNMSMLQEHQDTLQSILAANMARNETLFYERMQPVWLAGYGNEFRMELTFKIPAAQGVVIRRRDIEMVKFAWVQFSAVFAIFWFFYSWAEWVTFHFRIVPTRVISDLEKKKHRF